MRIGFTPLCDIRSSCFAYIVCAGSGIEDGPEFPEVQRQHNVQRTIRLRRVGVVTGHIVIRHGETNTNKDEPAAV